MSARLIVTLDGPAGVGKSTLARLLAQKLDIPFLDTGAMFRSIALFLGEEALEMDDAVLKEKLAPLSYGLAGAGPDSILLFNGKPLGNEIRNEKIGALASKLATNPTVREFLKQKQQEIGANYSLVAEGRDMGTVIFPDARCKFFLDAEPAIRAGRRMKQLAEQGVQADVSELEAQIRKRDEQDRNRAIAPLKAAKDAVTVDTSSLDQDEVLAELWRHVQVCID